MFLVGLRHKRLTQICLRWISPASIVKEVKKLSKKVADDSYLLKDTYLSNEEEILKYCHENKLFRESIALARDKLTNYSDSSDKTLCAVLKSLENAQESFEVLDLISMAIKAKLKSLNDPRLWLCALNCCPSGDSAMGLKLFNKMMQSCSNPSQTAIETVMKHFPPKSSGIRAKQIVFKLSYQLQVPFPSIKSLVPVFECFSLNPNGDCEIAFKLMKKTIDEYTSGRWKDIPTAASDFMSCFRYAIHACASSGEFMLSLQLLDNLIKLGFTPSEDVWCDVIRSVGETVKVNKRKNRSFKPNDGKGATITHARQLIHEMSSLGYNISILSYNSLLFVCSKLGLTNSVSDIRQDLAVRMIPLNAESWKYCILASVQASNCQEAVLLVKQVLDINVAWFDHNLALKLMKICADSHDITHADQILQLMVKHGVVLSLNLLNCYLSASKSSSFVYNSIKGMQSNYHMSPDVDSWAILVRLVSNPFDVRQIMMEMKLNNLQVSETIWRMSIEKCQESGDWQLAAVLFADFLMERKTTENQTVKLEPSSKMWSSLLATHVKANRRIEYDALLGIWERCK